MKYPDLFKSAKKYTYGLLRKTESLTGTDNVYLAKSGSYLLLTHGVAVLNGFILYVLISRFLPKEIYGQYKYFLSLFGLFSIACLTGIDVALSRSVARGFDGSLRQAFKTKLVAGFIGSLFGSLFGLYYVIQGREDLAAALFLISFFAPFTYAASTYGSFFVGKKRFGSYGKITIATGLIYFVGMGASVLFARDSLLLLAAFLVTGLTNVIAYLWTLGKLENQKTDPEMLPYAFHLSWLDILGVIANRIDGVLVFHFLGAAPLAVYSLATVPVEQMKGFLKTAQSVALPKFAAADFNALRSAIWRKLVIFMLVITVLIAIYILLAPLFFRIFFPQYLDSVPYSQVYALSLVFALPAALLMTLFQAKGMKKENTIFNVANYSVQIVLLVIGSWLYGLWGVIFARLISRILMLGTTHIILARAQAPGTLTDTNIAT